MAKKKQVKDTNVIKTPKVLVDPHFFIPTDVADVYPATDFNLEDADAGVELFSGSDDTTDDEETTDNSGGSATKTGNIHIISQKIRITSDGTSVVDVILGVSDDSGSVDYEVRLSVVA